MAGTLRCTIRRIHEAYSHTAIVDVATGLVAGDVEMGAVTLQGVEATGNDAIIRLRGSLRHTAGNARRVGCVGNVGCGEGKWDGQTGGGARWAK